MLRGMDAFPTLCHFDTRGRGRAVLRHAPQVVVMMMVGCLLGGLGPLVSRCYRSQVLCGKVSTAGIHFVLAEEGKGGCGRRLGWFEILVIVVECWTFMIPD